LVLGFSVVLFKIQIVSYPIWYDPI